MTAEGSTDRAWEDDIVFGLKSLTAEEMPSLEIILLDAVAAWMFSDANPDDDYSEVHAGHLISTLFSAVEAARKFYPSQLPPPSPEITAARTGVVTGAHELAAAASAGVSLAVSRLMPAMLAELQNNAGERAKQSHGVFVYLLYAIAVGTREEHDPAVLDGLTSTFTGWDTVLRGGFVLPWRRKPGEGAGSG